MSRPKRPPDETRREVERLLAEGCSKGEVARRLGISKPTVTYHATRLGLPPDERANRRYDWSKVQEFYDAGHSLNDCMKEFGMSRATLSDATGRGALVTRPQMMSIEELLSSRTRNRQHIKGRLLREGLLGNYCSQCGLTRWQGEELALQLHHINGDGKDNRLANLTLLCPNCHSLTESWGGRNRRRTMDAAASEEALDEAA